MSGALQQALLPAVASAQSSVGLTILGVGSTGDLVDDGRYSRSIGSGVCERWVDEDVSVGRTIDSSRRSILNEVAPCTLSLTRSLYATYHCYRSTDEYKLRGWAGCCLPTHKHPTPSGGPCWRKQRAGLVQEECSSQDNSRYRLRMRGFVDVKGVSHGRQYPAWWLVLACELRPYCCCAGR